MPVVRVTSKGRVTIPKQMRDELGIKAGTKLYFVRTSQGYVVKPVSSSVMRLSGMLKGAAPMPSNEDDSLS